MAAPLLTFLAALPSYACTGFIAGKDITVDGSRIVARTEDLGGAHNKTFIVYPRKENPAPVMFKDTTGFKIKLPKISYKYTAICDAEQSEGIYDEVGFNEYGVAISATVSASPNETVLKHDPLVETGLTEASLTTVVLPYVKTARETVERVAKIVDEHGAAEGNIIFFSDDKDIWYMEILSGHQYVAVKAPSNCYAVIPNCFLLGEINVSDTENVIASKNLINLPKEKGFYKEVNRSFHIAETYAEPMDDYNRARI
ncbi:putative dipeptidase B (fragment) [Treponema phagedenis]|uniref:Dipeptidase n=1 Tax=Treponema phagedenis TaxID=162 RepID=A0A0B7GWI7_TREPH